MSSFISLPAELLTECLLHLDAISMTRCRLVCKTLNDIVASSILLQYKLELEFDDLDDPGICRGFMADRHRRLLHSRAVWAHLRWNNMTRTPMPGSCSAYEVVGGKFVKMLWGKDFSVVTLPTSQSGATFERMVDLEGMIKDFAMDPSQDFIAYLEDDGTPPSYSFSRKFTMHLRTLSKNKPHPEASQSALYFTIEADELWANMLGLVTIQMMDDTLALFVRNPLTTSRLIIWNWKSGEKILDDETEEINRVYHFGFIDRTTYILTSIIGRGSIYIMKLRSGTLRPIVILWLPEIKSGVKVDHITTHTSAIPQNPTALSPRQDRRIHTFSVLYSPRLIHDEQTTHCLFVHNDLLLKYADAYDSASEPVYVGWEKWGRSHTRFQRIPGIYHWMRYTCGQKVVCPAVPGQRRVQVYDFNVHTSRLLAPNPSLYVVLEDSVIEAKDIFTRDVRTCLPYYSLTCQVPDQYSGFMIDEQRIIGLKSLDGPDGLELQFIDVFCFPSNY